MNIKSILPSLIPNDTPKVEKAHNRREIRSENGVDRDANGKRESDQRPKKELTDQELQEAMAFIRDIPGIKDNCLSVEMLETNGQKFVLIKAPDGKIVRRLPSQDLWQLTQEGQKAKGQIFDKAM